MASARGDLFGAAILSAVFISLIVIAEAWRHWGSPKPEWTRKLVHIGGGIACLFFPFLISSPWVVLGLAISMSAVFGFAGRLGFLKSLHGVERTSRGVEYYPLAVFAVFLLTEDREWLYLSSILVLAVGDASAALIGGRYGLIRYEVEDDTKSLEGSLMFLIIAFLAIQLPTLLLTDLPPATVVLSALLVAILVTGLESISLKGTDNLFVPLGVVYILEKITTKPVAEIMFQNASLLVICVGLALLIWHRPLFNAGAMIAIVLYAFASWSLGSWQWALPVFVGLVFYVFCAMRLPASTPRIKVSAIVRASVPPFLILFIANATAWWAPMFGPYLAALAVVLVIGLSSNLLRLVQVRRVTRLGMELLGLVALLLPPWFAQPHVSLVAPLAIVLVVFPLSTIAIVNEQRRPIAAARHWPIHRMVLSIVAGGLILILQIAGVIPMWNPVHAYPH